MGDWITLLELFQREIPKASSWRRPPSFDTYPFGPGNPPESPSQTQLSYDKVGGSGSGSPHLGAVSLQFLDTSPFFPGILLSRKPSEPQRKQRSVFENNG